MREPSGEEHLRFAHIPLSVDGPRCVCGARGCLYCVVGFGALSAAATARGIDIARQFPMISDFAGELRRRSDEGDTAAQSVIDEMGMWLGRAAGVAINAYAPSSLTLGGYPTRLGPRLTESMLSAAVESSPTARTVMAETPLGDVASRLGAAELARDVIFEEPRLRGGRGSESPPLRRRRRGLDSRYCARAPGHRH